MTFPIGSMAMYNWQSMKYHIINFETEENSMKLSRDKTNETITLGIFNFGVISVYNLSPLLAGQSLDGKLNFDSTINSIRFFIQGVILKQK